MTKRLHTYTVVLAALVCFFSTTESSARTIYNINPGWTFFTGDDTDSARSQVVNLPHTRDGIGALTSDSNVGNYVKDIEIPVEWQGRRVFIRVGGAATITDLFVNSRHAGEHRGGSTAFTFEITNLLRFGQTNNLRLVVNSSPRLDVLPTAGEERTYGGIYRNVELIVCEPLAVSPDTHGGDGIFVTTDRLSDEKAEGTVRLELLTPRTIPAGSRARVRFTDASGELVAQNSVAIPRSGTTLLVPFTVTSPHLWQGTADPYLYNVEVVISAGADGRNVSGTTLDSLAVRTGFRTVGIDPEGNFTLNGIATKIHGVVVHRDRPMTGTALAPFQIEEDVEIIRRMGANAVRVTGGRHSDYFYTLCDQVGLIVWNDSPFTGAVYPTDIDFVATDDFRANGREQFADMISQLYNHPSVAMWGVFSNVSLRGDDPVPYIRELNDLAHTLDAHRLTVASSTQDGEMNFVTDLVSFDLGLGWESGMPDGVTPWLAQLRSGWPNLRAAISYSAGASIFQRSEAAGKPVIYSNNHPEAWQTFFHEEYLLRAVDAPGLWGVFVGNMFDFGAVNYPWGDGRDINDHGLVTFDRKDYKDAYYLYKAAWDTSEPFVHIASARLGTRSERIQTVTVFSNLPEVELFAQGRSLGTRTGTDAGTGTGENGIFRWEGVELRTGVNRLGARATDGTEQVRDSISITFNVPGAGSLPPSPRTSQGR